MNFDIKQVAGFALDRIDDVLARWVPEGSYQGSEYVALNPTRSDNTKGSFSINRNTGAWADFADDQKGGDLVALVAYLDGVNQGEACKRLASFLGLDSNIQLATSKRSETLPPSRKRIRWQSILPVPSEAVTTCPARHYKNGSPSAVWSYHGINGELLMKVMRFDLKSNGQRSKDYRPLTFCEAQDGSKQQAWRWQQPTDNRPMYGLDRLASSLNKPILLTEGEKASDAAMELIQGYISMSWPGGSKALSKVDFSPIAGRQVVLWPDNDEAGIDSMSKLADSLSKLGCEVKIVSLEAFGGEWPTKADAADALSAGFTAEWFEKQIQSGDFFVQCSQHNEQEIKAPTPNNQGIPSQFSVSDDGVFFFPHDMDSNDEVKPIRICDRLDILAFSRAKKSVDWGVLVRFSDPDGITKELNISRESLATEGGGEVLRQLSSRGLMMEAGQQPRRRLIQYLQTSKPSGRYKLVNTLGWHNDAYLTPEKTFGAPEEPLYFYDDSGELSKMSSKGDLDSWKNEIAKFCINNPRLTFAASLAFAGPLLHLIEGETAGFHFHGDSSAGKSTLLYIAGSVCGPLNYQYKWRATDNALESIAAAHNDGLLLLDEMSQCPAGIVGDVAYMLGNGKAKARATDRGGVKSQPVEWRLMYLSSGEVSLSQHMSEAGKKPKAGQEIRLMSIPAEAGTGTGVFNDLHGHVAAKVFSEKIKALCGQYYGVAFQAFAERLCDSNLSALAKRIREERNKFSSPYAGKGQAQVGRASNAYALVGFAGEMATKAGITGWPPGMAREAAREVFLAWVNSRGGTGNLEDREVLSQIKLFFELSGESKFTRWDRDNSTADDHSVRTLVRCGYRKVMQDSNSLDDAPCTEVSGSECSEVTYYVTPEAFKSEVCGTYSHNKAKVLLAECGALEKDNQGGYTKPVRLPDGGRRAQRVYVIKPHLIPSLEDGEMGQEVA